MNSRKKKDFIRNKGFYISLLTGAICMVAVVAVCLNVFSDKPSQNLPDLNEPADFTEEQDIAEQPENTVGPQTEKQVADNSSLLENDIAEPEDTEVVDAPTDEELEAAQENEKKTEKANKKKTDTKEENPTVEVMGQENEISKLHFDQELGLLWPAAGNIILKYSMNNSIYFQTLGQYKTNPGIAISAAKGTEVLSATDCIVTDISENEEIGKIVKTSIGDNYTLLYGQLENLKVSVGDKLKEGDVIGTIAQPTKYYVVEGSNLYFQVLNGEETVDPMLLLR